MLRVRVLLAAGVFAAAWSSCDSASGAQVPTPESIGVAAFEMTHIDPPHAAGFAPHAAGFDLRVRMPRGQGVEDLTLQLSPLSLRAPGFVVIQDSPDGTPMPAAVDAPRTYRGTVAEWPGAVVAASIEPDGNLRAIIVTDEGLYGIQPLGDFGSGPGWHATYEPDDVLNSGHRCGVDDRQVALPDALQDALQNALPDERRGVMGYVHDHLTHEEIAAASLIPATAPATIPSAPATTGGYTSRGTANWDIAQIAFDADYLFYLANGSVIDDTVADIEFILNGMAAIYERDADITYTLTTVRVRSAPGFDPYSSSTSANTLLDEFRSHWNSEETGVTRDIAHLMTGRDLDGSTIGLAFTGVVCTNASFGLSQSRYTSNVVNRVALTSHEVGHNWSSPHCDSEGDCGIMCGTIGNCPGTQFGVYERDKITTHRNSRNCLTQTLPRPDRVVGELPADGASRVELTQANTLQLSWTASENASSYRVYLSAADGALPEVGTTSSTTFTTAPLLNATTYRWRIDAVGSGGTTVGTEWIFTTDFALLACGSDYTGDCVPDLLWWNASDGQVQAWRGLGSGTFAATAVALATVADTNWRVVASADFNRDGAGDIVWRNSATGDTAVWFMNFSEYLGAADLGRVTDQNWIVAGAADFTGDNQVDLLWHNTKTGDVSLWVLNGTSFSSAVLLPRVSDVNWQIVGVGEFGGPTGPDILWRNARSGATAVWYMNGSAYASAGDVSPNAPASDVNWQVVATLDLDLDGDADITWRNALTGQMQSWIMDGPTQIAAFTNVTRADPWRAQGQRTWRTLLAGDANGDHIRDITWRNANSGGVLFWLLNPRSTNAPFTVGGVADLPAVNGAWELAATGDLNRDNKMDLVWRLPSTGQIIIWLMNGTQVGAAIDFLSGGTTSWYMGALADVNRDQRDDMIWYNSTGTGFVWYLDGTPAPGSYLLASATLPALPTGFRMQGAADFDRDGYPDFVLRNTTTGEAAIWLMDQNLFAESIALPTVSTSWQMGTIGDFNGDSMPDIAWRNTVTGENAVWLMNGTSYVVSVPLPTVTDQSWKMVR